MNPLLQGLYVITDPVLTPPATLLAQVEAALRGGARIVQYRDKSTDTHRRLEQARQLRILTQHWQALLIINDDVTLCQQVQADGVHLGQDDTALAEARRQLGPDFLLGATCHGSPALAEQALAAGADYLAFGRFFPSQTKPDALPANLKNISPFLRHCPVPAVAIGGITLNNAAPLLDAGFRMLAVVNDVFAHQDIEGQCRRFSRLLGVIAWN